MPLKVMLYMAIAMGLIWILIVMAFTNEVCQGFC